MEQGCSSASSVNSVELFDCVTKIPRTTEERRPYNDETFSKDTPPYWNRQPVWNRPKWDTVPPLLELVAETMVVDNRKALIEHLLGNMTSAPIYSTLLARALHYDSEKLVRMILSKWPWSKLILTCGPAMKRSCQLESVVLQRLLNSFIKCAHAGNLNKLQFLDISDCRTASRYDYMGSINKLYGLSLVKKLKALILKGHKTTAQKYTIYDHCNVNIIQEEKSKNIMNMKVGVDSEIIVIALSGFTKIDRYHDTGVPVHTIAEDKAREIELIKNLSVFFNPGFDDPPSLLEFKKLTQLENIVDIQLETHENDKLDGFLKHIDSMNIGLRSFGISIITRRGLLPEHLATLKNSKHASTLRKLSFKFHGDMEKPHFAELFNLIESLSGTLIDLEINLPYLHVEFLAGLFKVLVQCKHLAALTLESGECDGLIDTKALADAAPLAGLPEFVYLYTDVNSIKEAKELKLAAKLNDYRAQHSPSTNRQRIHVVLNVLRRSELYRWGINALDH